MRLSLLLMSTAVLATIGLISACGPLDDDDPAAAGPTSTVTEESPATLPPMRIVTRTPVDPSQLAPTSAESPTSVEAPATYIVQEGDTLYSIANQFQLDIAEIVALNGLSDPNDISVGQELRLAAPVEE